MHRSRLAAPWLEPSPSRSPVVLADLARASRDRSPLVLSPATHPSWPVDRAMGEGSQERYVRALRSPPTVETPTLRRVQDNAIQQIRDGEQDAEMEDAFEESQPWQWEGRKAVIVDTNILLSKLVLLDEAARLLARAFSDGSGGTYLCGFIIPHQVRLESVPFSLIERSDPDHERAGSTRSRGGESS